MPKVYGYARCSTNENKQDIERQARDLEAMGAKTIFSEYGAGTDAGRPQLKSLLERTVPGDTIIATELSRFTRSVHHLCHLLEWAADRRVILKVGSFTADCTKELDPMAEGMILMMGAFGQLEHKLIKQRVKSGVSHARAKGKKLGRPPLSKEKLPKAFLKHMPAYDRGQISVSKLAQLVGCSRPTVYRYLAVIAKG